MLEVDKTLRLHAGLCILSLVFTAFALLCNNHHALIRSSHPVLTQAPLGKRSHGSAHQERGLNNMVMFAHLVTLSYLPILALRRGEDSHTAATLLRESSERLLFSVVALFQPVVSLSATCLALVRIFGSHRPGAVPRQLDLQRVFLIALPTTIALSAVLEAGELTFVRGSTQISARAALLSIITAAATISLLCLLGLAVILAKAEMQPVIFASRTRLCSLEGRSVREQRTDTSLSGLCETGPEAQQGTHCNAGMTHTPALGSEHVGSPPCGTASCPRTPREQEGNMTSVAINLAFVSLRLATLLSHCVGVLLWQSNREPAVPSLFATCCMTATGLLMAGQAVSQISVPRAWAMQQKSKKRRPTAPRHTWNGVMPAGSSLRVTDEGKVASSVAVGRDNTASANVGRRLALSALWRWCSFIATSVAQSTGPFKNVDDARSCGLATLAEGQLSTASGPPTQSGPAYRGHAKSALASLCVLPGAWLSPLRRPAGPVDPAPSSAVSLAKQSSSRDLDETDDASDHGSIIVHDLGPSSLEDSEGIMLSSNAATTSVAAPSMHGSTSSSESPRSFSTSSSRQLGFKQTGSPKTHDSSPSDGSREHQRHAEFEQSRGVILRQSSHELENATGAGRSPDSCNKKLAFTAQSLAFRLAERHVRPCSIQLRSHFSTPTASSCGTRPSPPSADERSNSDLESHAGLSGDLHPEEHSMELSPKGHSPPTSLEAPDTSAASNLLPRPSHRHRGSPQSLSAVIKIDASPSSTSLTMEVSKTDGPMLKSFSPTVSPVRRTRLCGQIGDSLSISFESVPSPFLAAWVRSVTVGTEAPVHDGRTIPVSPIAKENTTSSLLSPSSSMTSELRKTLGSTLGLPDSLSAASMIESHTPTGDASPCLGGSQSTARSNDSAARRRSLGSDFGLPVTSGSSPLQDKKPKERDDDGVHRATQIFSHVPSADSQCASSVISGEIVVSSDGSFSVASSPRSPDASVGAMVVTSTSPDGQERRVANIAVFRFPEEAGPHSLDLRQLTPLELHAYKWPYGHLSTVSEVSEEAPSVSTHVSRAQTDLGAWPHMIKRSASRKCSRYYAVARMDDDANFTRTVTDIDNSTAGTDGWVHHIPHENVSMARALGMRAAHSASVVCEPAGMTPRRASGLGNEFWKTSPLPLLPFGPFKEGDSGTDAPDLDGVGEATLTGPAEDVPSFEQMRGAPTDEAHLEDGWSHGMPTTVSDDGSDTDTESCVLLPEFSAADRLEAVAIRNTPRRSTSGMLVKKLLHSQRLPAARSSRKRKSMSTLLGLGRERSRLSASPHSQNLASRRSASCHEIEAQSAVEESQQPHLSTQTGTGKTVGGGNPTAEAAARAEYENPAESSLDTIDQRIERMVQEKYGNNGTVADRSTTGRPLIVVNPDIVSHKQIKRKAVPRYCARSAPKSPRPRPGSYVETSFDERKGTVLIPVGSVTSEEEETMQSEESSVDLSKEGLTRRVLPPTRQSYRAQPATGLPSGRSKEPQWPAITPARTSQLRCFRDLEPALHLLLDSSAAGSPSAMRGVAGPRTGAGLQQRPSTRTAPVPSTRDSPRKDSENVPPHHRPISVSDMTYTHGKPHLASSRPRSAPLLEMHSLTSPNVDYPLPLRFSSHQPSPVTSPPEDSRRTRTHTRTSHTHYAPVRRPRQRIEVADEHRLSNGGWI
ncbi:unnamed protein product [Parajaminaea phylloscopi]